MFLYTFATPPFETNCYVIGCEQTKKAAVIDPGRNSLDKILSLLNTEGATLEKILLTHSHWDHIGGVAALKEKVPEATILVHEKDAENLMKPGSDGLPCWLSIKGATPNAFLQDNQVFSLGKLSCQVIHTPGHSPGGVCFLFEKQKTLFSGDTLFKGTIGNLSFPTSEPKKMWDSLKKLSELPKDIVVYPGHGDKTTIGKEEATLSH